MFNSNDYTYLDQLLEPEWRSKRLKILNRDGYKCQMCGKTHSGEEALHVHHRYYLYNALAWEYEDYALITLCHKCHTLVHTTCSPLIYYCMGDRLLPMNFTACVRCSGMGYLPEYNHVQGGICFRCKGKKYEELICTNDIDLFDFSIFFKQNNFDLLKPETDKKKNDEIYQLGRRYQLGLGEYEYCIEKAYKYYRIAAMNGHGKAQNNYALLLLKGCGGMKKDYKNAVRWFTYSAMQGIREAQCNLTEIFKKGLGVPINEYISKQWELLYQKKEIEKNYLDFLKDLMSAKPEALKDLLTKENLMDDNNVN